MLWLQNFKNMIVNHLLVHLILILLISQTHTAIVKPQVVSYDMHGNLLSNNDAKFPASTCCVMPTCQNPHECYQTLTCGYMCSTGKYPPAEYGRTPGFKLKDVYSKFDCRFGDCRNYNFTCSHCQNPRDETFSIYLVRHDCKDCYYL